MSYEEQADKLAGPIALLKQSVPSSLPLNSCLISDSGVRFVTQTARQTAEDAVQIFGGRSITASGMGKLIENVRLLDHSLSFVLTLFFLEVPTYITI